MEEVSPFYQPLFDMIEGRDPEEVTTLLRETFYGLLRPSSSLKNVYSFGYNLIRTDFKHPASRLCRGLFAAYEGNGKWRILCCAFPKFFNYGESMADTLDQKTLVASDKLDGSLIKLYFYEGEWRIGTNNCPAALDAQLARNPEMNFDQIVREVANEIGFSPSTWNDRLNPAYCYIFELIHPLTQVVVHYNRKALIHLATRHVASGQEFDHQDPGHPDQISLHGIEKPVRFPFQTLAECQRDVVNRKEGFVLRDAQFRRIKLKSPYYVESHKNWGQDANAIKVWSEKRVIQMIIDETIDDYIGTVAEIPSYLEQTLDVIQRLRSLNTTVETYLQAYPTKKVFLAAFFKKYPPKDHKGGNPFFHLMVALYKEVVDRGKDCFSALVAYSYVHEKVPSIEEYLIPLPDPSS
jgi:hypothetical protein